MAIHPSSLQLLAHYFFLFFGLITIVGGIMGFVKARSVASLIAGGISGALLVVAGFMLEASGSNYTVGKGLALIVSLLLLGRFTPALARGKTMPAVYIVPLAAVGVILAVVLLLKTVPG